MHPDPPHPESMLALLAGSVQNNPQAIAVSCPGRGDLTYGDLSGLLDATRSALGKLGLRTAARIATLIPHGPEALTVPLALAAGGAKVIPLPTGLQPTAIEEAAVRLRVDAIVIPATVNIALPDALQLARVTLEISVDDPAGWFTLADDGESDGAELSRRPMPDDVAFVFQTSGTTAEPKAVPLTHGNICHASQAIVRSLALSSSDITIAVMPFHHVHGLICSGIATLAAGARVVCPESIGGHGFMVGCRDHRPTWYSAAPAIHADILRNHPGPGQGSARPPLRFIRSCSAPLDPILAGQLEARFDAPVIEAYGMTEAAHQICSNPLPPGRRIPGSVGCSKDVSVAIVDDEEHKLPAGVTGEVVVLGRSVMNGYENDPGSTREGSDWFHTGDLGYFDKEGYLFLTGRIKDQINRGGSMISPLRVESVLRQHPDISEAAVFAVKHLTLGENVAVAVVITGSVSDRDIREFVRAWLPNDHVPSQIVRVEKIPAGPTGKIQRSRLAEILIERPPDTIPDELPDAVEALVTSAWAAQLNVGSIQSGSNFFELGGDSLSGFRVVNYLNDRFATSLTVVDIFDNPVLSDLAQRIKAVTLARIDALTEAAARAEFEMLRQRAAAHSAEE